MAEVTKKPIPPLILGIVTAPMLAARRYPENLWVCDGVEIRADGLPPAEVLPAVEAFAAEKKRRGFKGPVVFTLRLRRDGGAWEDAHSSERGSLWLALSEHPDRLCDIVDVEIEEAASLTPAIWNALRAKKFQVLLSHHAFASEDSAHWDRQLKAMETFRPDGVKFAVTPENTGQVESLLRFARKVAEQFPLSCVIGMGEAARATRLVSPLLGCPITYAFLEDGPVAPGQLSVEALRACFARTEGRPAHGAAEKEWMDWAEDALQKFSDAR